MTENTKMDFVVRSATLEDYEVFREIYDNTILGLDIKQEGKTSPPKINLAEDDKLSKNFYREIIEHPTNKVLVCCKNGNIIGYTIIDIKKDKKWYINEFAIKYECMGKGYGKKFCKKIIEMARESKVKKISLFCPFPGARRFWQKMKFSPRVGGDYFRNI